MINGYELRVTSYELRVTGYWKSEIELLHHIFFKFNVANIGK